MRLDVSCRSAFAGETPHVATAHDCERPEAGGCLRLILSYVGDNGEYVAGRHTGLIPLHDNHDAGRSGHRKTQERAEASAQASARASESKDITAMDIGDPGSSNQHSRGVT